MVCNAPSLTETQEQSIFKVGQAGLVVSFMCVGIIHILYVCAPHAFSALKNLKEGVRSSGTADSSRFKRACRYNELKFGPLQEQTVILTR